MVSKQQLVPKEPTLIIGIGNPLRGDDGVGPFLAQTIAARQIPGVQAISAHQLLPEHAALLAEVERVLFVDACLVDFPEEAVVRAERLQPEARAAKLSHQITPERLLLLTDLLWGRVPEAWLIAVPVAQIAVGEGLSACCQRQAARALRLIAEELLG